MTIARAAGGHGWRLECRQWVPRPPRDAFGFFGDAYNLERITPPFLRFRILRVQGVPVGRGTKIDYRLRLHRLPVWWRTLIAEWTPPHRFVDTQIVGPFKAWHHVHEFRADGRGTEMRDVVSFDLYCRPLAATPLLRWVQPDLRRIFEFRRAQIRRMLEACGR